jgi:hypothetical protein
MLHAIVSHSGKIYMGLAASRMQSFHAPAASCVQSRQFLQARCENNYLNKKMKTPLKNLRIYATHVLARAYPLTLCMARSNLVRQFLYHKIVLQHLVTGLGNHKQKEK